MTKMLNQLRAFEIALHQHEVRTNLDKLKELLHPEFVEIGYSGGTYNFNSMLESLLSERQTDFEIWSQDYECNEYAPNIVQVIYLSASLSKDGNLTRHAKRTSMWVNETGNWKIKFHQATPVDAFEKSDAERLTSSRLIHR
jgi:hypothetical protein